MSFFSAEDICCGYGNKEVLRHLSFSLEKGDLLGILGANGSGKTTLLKAIKYKSNFLHKLFYLF